MHENALIVPSYVPPGGIRGIEHRILHNETLEELRERRVDVKNAAPGARSLPSMTQIHR